MLQTHFMEINARLEKLYKVEATGKQKFFSKETTGLGEFINDLGRGCYVCNLIDESFTRYIDTFFKLFSKEERVRTMVTASKGVCLPHLETIVSAAPKKLPAANLRLFYETIFTAQAAYMKLIEADLDWFAKKFDYRNQNEPWGGAKDAIERAIKRLCGQKED